MLDIDKLIQTMIANTLEASFSSMLDIDKLIHTAKAYELIASFSSMLDIDKLIPDNIKNAHQTVLVLCWILIN